MVGPINYGKDHNHYEKIDVVNASFAADADVVFRFRGQSAFTLVNEGPDVIEYSFNGHTLHGDLTPGTVTEALSFSNRRVSRIWFRCSGTGTVRVEAWSGVGSSIYNVVSGGIGVGMTAPISIFHTTFSLPGLTTMPAQMSFARTSTATVRTNASSVESLSSGQPGIAYTQQGYIGLQHEASRTNLLRQSQTLATSPWGGTSGVTADAASAPDGTITADRSVSSNAVSTFQNQAIASSSPYTFSVWIKPHAVASSAYQIASLCSPGTGIAIIESGWFEAAQNWYRVEGSIVTNATASQQGYFEHNTQDWSSLTVGPDNGIKATSQDLDMWGVQMELGGWSSSYIPTTSTAVTRAATFVRYNDANALLDDGRFSFHLRIVPNGKHADYTSDFYLWFIDSNNNAKITASTRILTITIGGSIVYTADTAIDWWQGRPLDIWLAVGNGITKFGWQKWDSGWKFASDGSSIGSLSFTNVPLYLLSGSTDTTHFDCVVQSIDVYLSNFLPVLNTTMFDAANVICDGNSLTSGSGAATTLGRWAEQAKRALGEGVTVDYASAVFGQTTGQMINDYNTDVALKYNPNARRNILVAWEITNDLLSYLNANSITAIDADVSGAVAYVCDRFKTYCQMGQTTGFSVIAVDVIARGQTAGAGANVPDSFEPARLLVNSWLAANWKTFATKFVQLGNHPKIGNKTVMEDSSIIWSSDGVHCTNLGYDVVAKAIVTQIKTLLS